MSFAAAVDHLHALTQELAPGTSAPRRKFDLAHMRILAHALGDPQTKFPSILIAGTTGKGSTAATLASILTAAGYRTGLYTSPHLTRVTERIRASSPPSHEGVISTERSEWRDPRISTEAPSASQKSVISTEAPSASEESVISTGAKRSGETPALAFVFPSNLEPRTSNLLEIPEPTFARLYFQVDDAARALVTAGDLPHHPSFFEALTALAFLYFAEIQVDIAVLEVGMGGRLDATNIVEPLLSVITDIALDHQDYLGHTLPEIAHEKAGILRPNGTLITLPQHPEANQAIGEAAVALNVRGINAADYLPGRAPFPTQEGVISTGARSAQWRDPRISSSPLAPNHYDLTLNHEPLRVRSPLAGQHQQRNIALAIAAAVELRNTKSYNIANSAMEQGIAATQWPGRLEFLAPNLLLDVAHNPAGAWTLRAAIASLPEDQPRTLIFSCLRDKDLREMAQILFPLFDSSTPLSPPHTSSLSSSRSASLLSSRSASLLSSRSASVSSSRTASVSSSRSASLLSSRSAAEGSASPPNPTHHLILTPIANPRAASLDDLIAAARALDVPAHPAHTPAEALALARSLTPANGVILATGSIYLIGALREAALTP